MDSFGMSLTLNNAGGPVGQPTSNLGVALRQPLVGTLSIFGLVNEDGAAITWMLNPGDGGVHFAPHGGRTGGGQANYSLTHRADCGKVVLFFESH